MSQDKYIALSGGFDFPHIGHMRMFADASCFGKVIVLLNSDAWLLRKKSHVVMPFAERKEMLEHMRHVYCVLPAIDNDDTVCASIENLKDVINYFGNGGDRTKTNTPEDKICEKYEIPIIYGLGGNKVQSSSTLAQKQLEAIRNIKR